MDKEKLLRQIDQRQKEIKQRRPLTEREIKELDEYFKIGLTYTSNALEGNSLTLTETKVLLEDGITVGGKPIRDCFEATGHGKAYDYMLSLARSSEPIFTQQAICRLHQLFYGGIDAEQAGKYRDEQVIITGTDYVPPAPEDVPKQMDAFLEEFARKETQIHPVELAALAHRKLVDIHPFVDGNGRTARLLMNLILVRNGYCIVSIPPILRHDYIVALQKAQRGRDRGESFLQLICECEMEAQRDYCRLFHIQLKPKKEQER